MGHQFAHNIVPSDRKFLSLISKILPTLASTKNFIKENLKSINMKKKILILSVAVNIIAGAFILYAFTPKAKNGNDGGGGYITMRVVDAAGGYSTELSVSDGNTILDHQDLTSGFKAEKSRENNQIITKKMNNIRNQGYELISSNAGGVNGTVTNYIFLKK